MPGAAVHEMFVTRQAQALRFEYSEKPLKWLGSQRRRQGIQRDALVETVREPLLVLDKELRVESANRAFYRVFGVEPRATIGRSIYDLGNRQWDIPRLRELLEEILPQKTTIEDFRVEHVFESIGPRIMLLNARQVHDAEHKTQRILLAIEDITERSQGATLLQLQRDTLEMLVEGTPLPQVLGALAREMEKRSQHKVMAAVHMLDQTGTRFGLAVAPSLPDSYRRATEGMDVKSRTGPCCVAVLTRKPVIVTDVDADPQWRAFAEFAAPLGIRAGWSTPIVSSQGEIVGTFANYYEQPRDPSVQDIAVVDVLTRTVALAIERARAQSDQARLAAIVTSSDDAIISKDLDGVIMSWNRGAQQLFGYTAEEAIGKPVTMLIPDDHLDEEPQILRRIRSGESVDHYETVRRRKDGTLIDISLTVSPLRDAAGRIIGASKIARDITQRKRAEDELRESDRRKTEFLATLAHELRNPLAPIRNAVQVLRRTGGSGENVLPATEMMERQVGHMVRLVDDLLDVSRISHGRIELRRERIELGSVIHHAVEAVRPLAECSGVDLIVTTPPQPMYLNADATRLAQVLENLLNNACKFTGQSGRIWLSVEQEGEHAVIRVRDAGIGIATDQLTRIFDMFTQVDTSLERPVSGLGIGLSLVKGLVEMHGGTVEAHSAGVGHGSEFTVRLPLAREASPELPEPTVSELTITTPRRVLVVDDNQDSAESLALLLKLAGHETHIAYDGLEAVQAAAAFRPDVVLLDLGLPKMNGYEAARRMRAQSRNNGMVLVALTGWGQEEDRQKSRAAGFDAHIVKPVDPAVLSKLLAEMK